MDDPLTRRKSSEAVLLNILDTVFPKPAAEPGAGEHCPQIHLSRWLGSGAS